MHFVQHSLSVYSFAFILAIARYFLTALLGWAAVKGLVQHYRDRISGRTTPAKQIQQEIFNSVQAISIFALFWTIALSGWTPHNQLYFEISARGWLYLASSFVGLLLLHDTFVYWIHRLMHHPRLYRHFHQKHHRSVHSSPFSGYSLDVSEAVLHSLFFLLVSHLIPLHWSVIVLVLWVSSIANVIGHLGYEAMPASWLKYGGLVFNTTTHHDLHHTRGGKYNYGVYFRFWDWVMGTEAPDYEAVFAQSTRSKQLTQGFEETYTVQG